MSGLRPKFFPLYFITHFLNLSHIVIKTAIAGGSSAIAGEIIRLIINHPDVDLRQVISRSMNGHKVADVHPGMTGDTDLRFTKKLNLEGIDLLFLCNTADETREWLEENPELPAKLKVIDLSGAALDRPDFIYGLPELERKAMVRGGSRVAVPQSLTTILNLALLPLARNLMLANPIYATAISPRTDRAGASAWHGISNVAMDRPLRHAAAEDVKALMQRIQTSFDQPIHLVAMHGSQPRGTLACLILDCATDLQNLHQLYEEAYSDHNFVWLIDRAPELKDVVNTNKCLIHLQRIDGRLVITAAMDNLLKGGAGTAVHAMNLLFGLHETTGLTLKTSTYY